MKSKFKRKRERGRISLWLCLVTQKQDEFTIHNNNRSLPQQPLPPLHLKSSLAQIESGVNKKFETLYHRNCSTFIEERNLDLDLDF